MFGVLWIPEFALQAVLRTRGDRETFSSVEAVALLRAGEHGQRESVVVAASPAARRAGIVDGQTAPQALAVCATLELLGAQPDAEREAQAALLAVAFSLSPLVEATADGLVTAEVGALAVERREPALRRGIAQLAAFGLEATAGLAATPLLASLAARQAAPSTLAVVTSGRDFLRDMPVAVAGPTREQAEILRGWGVRTLGQLSALPRGRIAERLGADGVALWERAAGGERRPLRAVPPAREFRARHEAELAWETLEPLLFVLRRLLDRLLLELDNAMFAAGAVRLELTTEDEGTQTREIRLPEPTTQAELIFRALHTYLENLRTDAAIQAVAVELVPVRPLARQQGIFDSSLRDVHGFTDTLARAMAVVGTERVGTPVCLDTHADDAVRLEPPAVALPEPAPPAPVPPHGLALRRCRPPRAATVELTEGRPTFVWTETTRGAVAAHRGPWIGAGDWWEAARSWQRLEWDVELADGGIYRLVHTLAGWFVDGEYD